MAKKKEENKNIETSANDEVKGTDSKKKSPKQNADSAKNSKEEEIIVDESIFDDNDEEKALFELFKNIETKLSEKSSGKPKGAKELKQEEITDELDKYDISENDFEKLIEYLNEKGYTIINDEEDASELELDVNDMIKAEQEAEAEDAEFESDDVDDAEKDELSAIDDFSKIQSGEVKINDSVKMYLKEIGKVDLLNAKQETELAQRIIRGEEANRELTSMHQNLIDVGATDITDYKEWLKTINFKSENKEAFAKKCIMEDGKEAKDNLITANLRLVISIARHYVGRGMAFLDLIQEGNMGLIKAVEKFDYTKGFKFSTYATWWIRQAITRAIADQARTIRIPVHMVETINKMTRVQRQLVQEYGRDPTPEEISQAMEGALSPERIREIQRIALEPVSLETPIGEEDDSHLGDFIEDKDAQSPEEFTTKSLLKEELYKIMGDLTAREASVLKLRYGLEDGHPRTLEEVGKEFGVTRERIRQIEAKAIRKLRHPTRAKRLGDYKDCVVVSGPDTHK